MFTLTTPRELRITPASRLRALRLAENLSQATLAKKAGVSLSSLKRFEREGLASFELFVAVVACLGRLEELEGLFKPDEPLTIAEIDRREARCPLRRSRQMDRRAGGDAGAGNLRAARRGRIPVDREARGS